MTSSNIDFVYQNKIIKIKNPDSNETLLNYVRTKLKKLVRKKVVQREAGGHARLY